MTESWARTKELFSLAVEQDPAARYAFLREICGTDDAPVSYTHLDVYKRQVLGFAGWPLAAAADVAAGAPPTWFSIAPPAAVDAGAELRP